MNSCHPSTLVEAIATALDQLGGIARTDVPLGPLTTCRVGGAAAIFVLANTEGDVASVAMAVKSSGLPLLTVGRGSNMLVADSGFDGIAMLMGDGFDSITFESDDVSNRSGRPGVVLVEAGAATPLPVLARRTASEGLTGLEWMVGVPGSVGGAVRMNAGGHGADIAASLIDVRILDVVSEAVRTVAVEALGLRFRGSDVTPDEVVLSARFALDAGDSAAGESMISEIVKWRRENQPGGQNAGSVFVNPFDGAESAGRLIDELGLKGFRMGSAHVSSKHANFIQADEGGSADDVRALMATIAKRVDDAYGIRLRSEIRLIGFDTDSVTRDETS